jgi:uncharacterized protein
MPRWGLTEAQIDTQPWGLTYAELSPRRGKVITDPVHGDIFVTPLELKIIDSPSFQRLRRVRQLGTTHLVYPGATHSRFSHSLGALRVVQDLLSAALQQRQGSHGVPDLFEQWVAEDTYDRDVARATVLARLGALLHDLCHVPFGHSIEDDLKILEPHDENRIRLDRLWAGLGDDVVAALNRDGLRKQLEPLILSKDRSGRKPWERIAYPFVADLVGDTICADLLDYLKRDHLNTGLPFSLGWRFQSAFYVVPDGRPPHERRMVLNVTRNGHERPDVISELLKALRYRYELSERALAHHAKLSADAMVGKALELWSHAEWLQEARRRHRDFAGSPSDDIDALQAAYQRQHGQRAASEARSAVREALEDVFCRFGDDGLLEHLRDVTSERAGTERDPRLTAVNLLVRDLLRRKLYALRGRVSRAAAPATALHKRFGDADARRQLERDAERYAELDGSRYAHLLGVPKVVIWLPDPSMRLKLAEVLVDHGGTIDSFVEYERQGPQRGSEIYDAHSRLWAIWVFVHRDVNADDALVVLAYLARRLGVRWERHEQQLGSDPSIAPDHLAARLAVDSRASDDRIETLIERVFESRARADTDTFEELRTRYRQAARADGDEHRSASGPQDA